VRLAVKIRRAKRITNAVRAKNQIALAGRCSCGGPSGVTDTRPRGNAIFRRRGCPKCGERWTTAEIRVAGRHNTIEAAVVDALLIAKLEGLLRRMKALRGLKETVL